jgi:hypothetical protein
VARITYGVSSVSRLVQTVVQADVVVQREQFAAIDEDGRVRVLIAVNCEVTTVSFGRDSLVSDHFCLVVDVAVDAVRHVVIEEVVRRVQLETEAASCSV